MAATVRKPQCLVNYESRKIVTDTLHNKSDEILECNKTVCHASKMSIRMTTLDARPPAEIISHATAFLEEYFKSLKKCESHEHKARLQEVIDTVVRTGTYDLTYDELEFGAKLAWRNAPRCPGRITWNQLQLVDARHVNTAKEMFPFMLKHIDDATNNGNIRSIITIFPQRKAGQRDFRIWNKQYISYAGYEQADGSVIGDRANAEFTKVCQKLGWRGKGGRFDVLPLVVSAPTGQPELMPVPEDKILRVPLSHPKYEWFKDLNLEWFGVPTVTSMMLDVGGIQFPCAPFNGWYTSPEIGTRNLCDVQRFNLMQMFGERFGLDTRSATTLWKDKASLEVNIAVLHSFKEKGVVIVDHHTISETFMQFYHNEHRQRGGCPADWVWIVPPISGALTPVFHQEMSLYYLKPAYEYQPEGWVAFDKQNKMISGEEEKQDGEKPFQRFRKIVIAVVFASTLYAGALARRVRIAILYATETGKAEVFASNLAKVLSRSFNPEITCMADYDVSKLSSETFVAVIGSTTGSGEPPLNGQEFAKKLYNLQQKNKNDEIAVTDSSSFWDDYNEFVTNVKKGTAVASNKTDEGKQVVRMKRGSSDLINGKTSSLFINGFDNEHINGRERGSDNISSLQPADRVSYAVFALGSRDYENFCAFGRYVDHMLFTLGGERLMDTTLGDEATNQQEVFNTWSSQILKVCCDRFQVEHITSGIPSTDQIISGKQVKLEVHYNSQPLAKALSKLHGKCITTCSVVASETLFEKEEKWYQKIVISTGNESTLQYEAGDHIGVLPVNNPAVVTEILSFLHNCPDPDTPIQLFLQSQENGGTWAIHPQLEAASIGTMLSRFLDITSTPSPALLKLLAEAASNNSHRFRLSELATNNEEYTQWKKWKHPSLLEVLREFPSVRMDTGLLLCRLPLLQPRLYSISSSSDGPGQLSLTVASFTYRIQGGKGPLHQGVCTSYLKKLKAGDTVEVFHRSAPDFHLPQENAPIILLGAGSGVAPFRGFWLQLHNESQTSMKDLKHEVTLYYGCQTRALDLYAEEKESMRKAGVLKETRLALSRDPSLPKTYVQDLLLRDSKEIYDQLVVKAGHIYVCGNEGLASGVQKALLSVIQEQGRTSVDQARRIIRQVKEERRYHEDIFGSGSST